MDTLRIGWRRDCSLFVILSLLLRPVAALAEIYRAYPITQPLVAAENSYAVAKFPNSLPTDDEVDKLAEPRPDPREQAKPFKSAGLSNAQIAA